MERKESEERNRPRLWSDPGVRKREKIKERKSGIEGDRVKMLGEDFCLKYSEEVCKKKRSRKKEKECVKGKNIKFMQEWMRSASLGRFSKTKTDAPTDNFKCRDSGNRKAGDEGI